MVAAGTVAFFRSSVGGGRCLRPSPFSVLTMDDEHKGKEVVVGILGGCLTVERCSLVEEEQFLFSSLGDDNDDDDGGNDKSRLLRRSARGLGVGKVFW